MLIRVAKLVGNEPAGRRAGGRPAGGLIQDRADLKKSTSARLQKHFNVQPDIFGVIEPDDCTAENLKPIDTFVRLPNQRGRLLDHRKCSEKFVKDTLQWWNLELELDPTVKLRADQGRKTFCTYGARLFGYNIASVAMQSEHDDVSQLDKYNSQRPVMKI